MLQLTPQSRIFLAVQPVDFRKGIDGLAALCRNILNENPTTSEVEAVGPTLGRPVTILSARMISFAVHVKF